LLPCREPYKELSVFEHTGDSFITDPRGKVIAGPAHGETILIAEGSLQAVLAAKAAADLGGRYSRPDIFQLCIDRRPRRRLVSREHVAAEAFNAVESSDPFGPHTSLGAPAAE
jgi:hypothetical protein